MELNFGDKLTQLTEKLKGWMKFYFVGHYLPQADNFDGLPNIDKMKTNI